VRAVIICGRGVCNMAHGFYLHHMPVNWSALRFGNGLTTLLPSARSYAPHAQVPRRLGAGAPLTVLRFAPLARLRPVLGFCA
jgi:hypothetical protein